MVTICGLGNYNVGIFHLFNHAFFKALLFLTAGAVIHALANEQDIRKFGGLQQILIFSYCALAVGSLALVGSPFLTGFYSKDVILELAYARYGLSAHFSYLLTCFSVLTTSYYSFRLLFFFFNTPRDLQGTLKVSNLHKQSAKHAHDAPWVMCLVLAILAIGSIYAGWLFKPMFIGLGTDFWNNALTVKPDTCFMIEAEFLPNHVKLLPLWLTMSGALLAYVFTGLWVHRSYNLAVGYVRPLYVFLSQRWFYDKLLNHYVGYSGYNLGFELLKVFDKGLLELMPFFGLGLPKSLKALYIKLGATQSGIIYHYATIMILAAFCALALLSFTNLVLFIPNRVLALMCACLIMF